MALTVSADEEKRLKGLGFINNKKTDNFSARVVTLGCRVTAEQAHAVADAAQKYGDGRVLLTSRMCFEIPGIPYENVEAFDQAINDCGLCVGGTGPRVRPIVSCKGTLCQHALLDSFDVSEELFNRFYVGYHKIKLPHKFKIAVGGCPNNCVKPTTNDLGIIGQKVPTFNSELCKGCKKCAIEGVCKIGAAKVADGKMAVDTDKCIHCGKCVGTCPFGCFPEGAVGYKITIGGLWGREWAVGRPLNKLFTSKEETLDTIEKAILLFRDQAKPSERFGKMIDRIGFEKAEAMLLSDELMERKDEILAKEL